MINGKNVKRAGYWGAIRIAAVLIVLSLALYPADAKDLKEYGHDTEDYLNAWNNETVARMMGCDNCSKGDDTCSLGSAIAAVMERENPGVDVCGYVRRPADYYGYLDADDHRALENNLYTRHDGVYDTKLDYESGIPDIKAIVNDSVQSIVTNVSAYFVRESEWRGIPYWLHIQDPGPAGDEVDMQNWVMPCARSEETGDPTDVEYYCRWNWNNENEVCRERVKIDEDKCECDDNPTWHMEDRYGNPIADEDKSKCVLNEAEQSEYDVNYEIDKNSANFLVRTCYEEPSIQQPGCEGCVKGPWDDKEYLDLTDCECPLCTGLLPPDGCLKDPDDPSSVCIPTSDCKMKDCTDEMCRGNTETCSTEDCEHLRWEENTPCFEGGGPYGSVPDECDEEGCWCCWKCNPAAQGTHDDVENYCAPGGAIVKEDFGDFAVFTYDDYPVRLPNGYDLNDDILIYDPEENTYTLPGTMPDVLSGDDNDLVRDRYWKHNATDTEFYGTRPGYCNNETPNHDCIEDPNERDVMDRPASRQHDPCKECLEKEDSDDPFCPNECFNYDLRYYRQFNLDSVWVNVFKIVPEVHYPLTPPPEEKIPDTNIECLNTAEGRYECKDLIELHQRGCAVTWDVWHYVDDCVPGLDCVYEHPEFWNWLHNRFERYCCPPKTEYRDGCCRDLETHLCILTGYECPIEARGEYLYGVGEAGCRLDTSITNWLENLFEGGGFLLQTDCADYYNPLGKYPLNIEEQRCR
ncbi:MAG: hypothetical protein V1744_00785 [Candidatus Altiarchaeota archaeon]